MTIYCLDYYNHNFDGLQTKLLLDGTEYFLSKKQQEKRLYEIKADVVHCSQFELSPKTVYKLNFHSISRDKKTIRKLESHIEKLKKEINNKVQKAIKELTS